MVKVSIVIPVYKVEKYLARCINSIQEQSLKDIEIILVDDGSPDECPEICDRYAKEDKRIKVVHKQNGGLSSARNAGMAVATGKYISFVDSDDTVSPDMYDKMVRIIEEQKVDFVMSDYIRISSNGETYLKSTDISEGRYDKKKIISVIYPQLIMNSKIEYGPLLSVCQCLYNHDFLKKNEICFDEKVRWSEDNIFSAIVGCCVNSFYYMKNEGLYHYYQNEDSITTGYRKECWNVYKTMNIHLHDYFDKIKDYDFSEQLKYHLIYYSCNSIGQISRSGEPIRKQIKMIAEIMNDVSMKKMFKGFKFPTGWNWKQKVQILFLKYRMAWLYRMVILK